MAQLDIYNKALSLARARTRLLTVNDEGEAAYQCNLWYDTVRRTSLGAAHWNFARTTVKIYFEKVANVQGDFNEDFNLDFGPIKTPPFPWYYGFVLPNDCIRALYVYADVSTLYQSPDRLSVPTIAWSIYRDRVDQKPKLVSNYSPINLTYIADVTDVTQWDVQFENAVTFALAAYLAQTLSGDEALVKLRVDAANKILMDAQVGNANEEENSFPDWTPSWLAVRGDYIPCGPRVLLPGFGPLFLL